MKYLVNYRKHLIILLAVLSLLLIYQYNLKASPSILSNQIKPIKYSKEFSSECQCRQNQNIKLSQTDRNSSLYTVHTSDKTYTFSLNDSVLTCDWYNSLRRGKQLRVLSFSLYNRDERYYKLVIKIVRQVKRMYPGWIMRVYHDNTINEAFKCQMECLRDEADELLDNCDFCDITQMPQVGSLTNTINGNNMHAMIWRFVTIGDTFVDVFSSRDIDSLIIQREVDSVNEWLHSNKIGHIMRGRLI